MANIAQLTIKHATALQQLLPPGAALRFAHGSIGHKLLTALATEHARIEQAAGQVADQALVLHAPGLPLDYRLSTLQTWLDDHYPDVIASYGNMRPLRAGFRAGARCHSSHAVFMVRLAAPAQYLYDNALRAGFRAGDRCNSTALHSHIKRETIRHLLMSHVDIIITRLDTTN